MKFGLIFLVSPIIFDHSTINDQRTKTQIENLYKLPENVKLEEEITQVKAELITAAQSGEYLIDPTLWVWSSNEKNRYPQ